MAPIGKILFVMFILTGLVGCASMNKSECLNADWQMIGMEDGSQGQPVSHIGKHRRACADYNVTPDLVAYEAGHAAGMEQYCTESKGFRLGEKGGFYGGVCQTELEENFLTGYTAGKKIHVASLEARQAADAARSNQVQLDKLKKAIKAKQVLLVSPETSVVDRIQLLEEIVADARKAEDMEARIPDLENDKEEKQAAYEELKKTYRY